VITSQNTGKKDPLTIETDSFEPSTEIVKCGHLSDYTSGLLLNTKSTTSITERDTIFKIQNAVAVSWKPNHPFTISRDSGSIYYAVRGSLRFPIAIHLGVSVYITQNKNTFGLHPESTQFKIINLSFILNFFFNKKSSEKKKQKKKKKKIDLSYYCCSFC